MESVSKLIHNEQAKLTATWLNGISVAALAVGGIGPIIGAASGTVPASLAIILAFGWIAVGIGLHLWARNVLRRLKDAP